MMHHRITLVKPRAKNAGVHKLKPATPPETRGVIKRLAQERGYVSDRQIALDAQIPQPTLARFLNGTTQDMDLRNLRKLADLFGVTLGQLLGEVPIGIDPQVQRVMLAMERCGTYGRTVLAATADALLAGAPPAADDPAP